MKCGYLLPPHLVSLHCNSERLKCNLSAQAVSGLILSARLDLMTIPHGIAMQAAGEAGERINGYEGCT